jgi:hypothetical protein
MIIKKNEKKNDDEKQIKIKNKLKFGLKTTWLEVLRLNWAWN